MHGPSTCLVIAVVATLGCGQPARPAAVAPPPSPTPAPPPVDPEPPPSADAPRDLPPRPPITYRSIDEALALDGDEPPTSLAGFNLGDREGEDGYVQLTVNGWGRGSGRTTRGPDGAIRQIIVELTPDVGRDDLDVDVMSQWIADAEARVRARWGKPVVWHGRRGFRGKASQLFVNAYDGFRRGTPSLVIVLQPRGDDLPCGPKDGFAAFHRKFDAALLRRDARAVEAMLDPGSADEVPLCRADLAPAARFGCVRKAFLALHGRARPFCNLSHGVYVWRTPRGRGARYFVFRRSPDRAWKAYGPFAIAADENPDALSP